MLLGASSLYLFIAIVLLVFCTSSSKLLGCFFTVSVCNFLVCVVLKYYAICAGVMNIYVQGMVMI
jgi:hypothetical protein